MPLTDRHGPHDFRLLCRTCSRSIWRIVVVTFLGRVSWFLVRKLERLDRDVLRESIMHRSARNLKHRRARQHGQKS